MPPQSPNPTQTVTITNFGGRLTRILNGDMNSGFSKFVSSFGYDPFSKPMNLTWLETPTDITGPTGGGLMVAAKPRNTGVQYVYAVNSAGKFFQIQTISNPVGTPNLDSVVGVTSIVSGSPTYLYGASMDFYGTSEKVYISSDNQINTLPFAAGFVGADSTLGSTNMAANVFHPLRQQFGKLLFGNGNTIGAIDSTGTITSSVVGTGQGSYFSEINPALGVEQYVHDLDVSVDGNYSLITASGISTEQILTVGSDTQSSSSSDGTIFRWNGQDKTVTSFDTIPSYAVTALQVYLQNNTFFSNDALGSSLNDGTNKILSLPNNKPPLPNATCVNGNFITWVCPEISADGSTSYASMYYFGSLDQENPPGLFRVMRFSAAHPVYQTPLNLLTNNKYTTIKAGVPTIASYGKHYFSVMDSSSTYTFYRFLITPTGSGTPQLGVYETQTQLFSKRMTSKQIRVYTEPTAANNGFQIDLIGSDGSVLTNGTGTYTYAAGTDPTLLQGALQRIDFNLTSAPTYAMGVRITNTGTVNMTIKKIEIDWVQAGK